MDAVMTGITGDVADKGTLGTPLSLSLLLPLLLLLALALAPPLPLSLSLSLLEYDDATRSAGLVTRKSLVPDR